MMTERNVLIDGVTVPRFLYGTAWKEDESERLTATALRQGFRGIDTANQRRHYHEAGVGRGVATSIANDIVTRNDLFYQTKFTFRDGQDHRLPYDPAAPIAVQVQQSFLSSLDHLQTNVIDSYLLHGPSTREGLAAADWEAWRTMEAIHKSGQARLLGISNVTLKQIQELCKGASVPPRFVQNRCYAITGWDREVRTFCRNKGITYQGFSLLTANRQVLSHPDIVQIAKRLGRTIAQVIFRFALDLGMIPLTGTTDADHMQADLEVFDFELPDDVVSHIERFIER